MLCGGRLGRPLRFLFVDFVILDSDGMCSDRWGFARAHLEDSHLALSCADIKILYALWKKRMGI